jgi:hypothetical protein
MGIRTNDKWVNYSHGLHKPNNKFGWCIVVALLVHKQATSIYGLIRFTMPRTWGKPPPSPLKYSLYLSIGLHPNVILSQDSQVMSLEIFKIRTFATLKAHNFFV